MSQAWQTKTASPRQVNWINDMIQSKDLSGLDEGVLELVADVESGVAISGGVASTLIDALKVAPRKPFAKKEFAPLVSDYAQRQARFAKATADYDAARKAAEEAKAAAGGHLTPEGFCVKCQHNHLAEQCGVSVEVRMSDYSDYYSCSCTDITRGTAASQEARRLWGEEASAHAELGRAGLEAEEIRKGDQVVAYKGRKVAKGTTGQVVHLSESGYGWSALLLLADGTKVWCALSNLQHVKEG